MPYDFKSRLTNRTTISMSCINRLEISIGSPTIEEIREGFLFFLVAGGGLVSSVIYTIPPNLPLSALRFFSLLRFGKTILLFCSRLNRNADKGDLWQDLRFNRRNYEFGEQRFLLLFLYQEVGRCRDIWH